MSNLLQKQSSNWIEQRIHVLREQKVMLSMDLARLYEIEHRVLNQAVKRHLNHFPEDFMFQLSREEYDRLKSQSVISSEWGGQRHPPFAFTEQGVAMLSSVLKSPKAIEVNIEIMRAFVRLRKMFASHQELAQKLQKLEEKYDAQFEQVFEAIRQMMLPPETNPKRMGF